MARKKLLKNLTPLGRAALLILVIGGALSLCFFLFGCKAAYAPDGRVVVGFDVARVTDTPDQILQAGASMLPEPWRTLALSVGATGLGGIGVGYMARRAKKMADEAFDEGAARAGPPSIAPPPVPQT